MADWRGKRVVVLGAARQGTALARYLAYQGAQVVLNDRRQASELEQTAASLSSSTAGASGKVDFVFGGHPIEILDGADLVCLSGGVPLTLPLVQQAQARGIPLSNDSQIFLEAAPCRVIGITGSAGKTTTTTLVGRMAQEAANEPGETFGVFVGGNIGTPLISNIDKMQPGDICIMELSSFQLEVMTISPDIAVVLNITPNHLDRHASMEEYIAAKARILDNQDSAGAAVLGRDDPGSWGLADRVRGRLVSFGQNRPSGPEAGVFIMDDTIWLTDGRHQVSLLPCDVIELRGQHNLMNVMAACAVAALASFSPAAIQAGVAGFTGVAHRLELIRSRNSVCWYNDSIATAPERSIAAIRSFDEPIVLLAGGRDKNLPWNDFANLVRQRVDHLVVFGEAAGIIAGAVGSTRSAPARPYTITACHSLKDAVEAAAEVAEPGYIVLLSPGGTSFDEFRDFEDRGEAFRKWVMELP
jgi:UDP-N-acetylmuramoylalanine--D-glutamate ligase